MGRRTDVLVGRWRCSYPGYRQHLDEDLHDRWLCSDLLEPSGIHRRRIRRSPLRLVAESRQRRIINGNLQKPLHGKDSSMGQN